MLNYIDKHSDIVKLAKGVVGTINIDPTHRLYDDTLCEAIVLVLKNRKKGIKEKDMFRRVRWDLIDYIRWKVPGGSRSKEVVTIQLKEDNYRQTFKDFSQKRAEEKIDAELTVQNLMKYLDDKEKYVITEHFLAGRNLKDIGEELGVSESRVCQISRKALKRMNSCTQY